MAPLFPWLFVLKATVLAISVVGVPGAHGSGTRLTRGRLPRTRVVHARRGGADRRGRSGDVAVPDRHGWYHEFGSNRPDTPTKHMKSPSVLQTILRSYLVQSVNMNSFGIEPADVVVEPDVTQFDLAEFSRTDELAAIGETSALEAIPEINKLLAQLDDRLFPLT